MEELRKKIEDIIEKYNDADWNEDPTGAGWTVKQLLDLVRQEQLKLIEKAEKELEKVKSYYSDIGDERTGFNTAIQKLEDLKKTL